MRASTDYCDNKHEMSELREESEESDDDDDDDTVSGDNIDNRVCHQEQGEITTDAGEQCTG